MIISAFIDNINKNDKSIDQYLENGKKLLFINLPKTIFVEKHIYEKLHSNNEIYPNTYFIIFDKYDLRLFKFNNLITNFNINTNNPTKDTINYMLTMNSKTDFINKAIKLYDELNYNYDNYVWIDFGIYYLVKNSELFTSLIQNIFSKSYNKIRIPGCWNLNTIYSINLLTDISWYFCGGIFGGNRDYLLNFSELVYNKCLDIINKYNTLPWEVNIWYLIYKDNPDLFDWFSADHNLTMFNNY